MLAKWAVSSAEAQIRHINPIPLLPQTHQEVLDFDVSMDDTPEMHTFQTTNELIDEDQHALERELATAEVELVVVNARKKTNINQLQINYESARVINLNVVQKRKVQTLRNAEERRFKIFTRA